MSISPFGNAERERVQKTEHWNEDQIDAVERAKQEQRRREQQANQEREGHRADQSAGR